MMKNLLKMHAGKRGELHALAKAASVGTALATAKKVGFHRALADAQPDEKERFDAIYPTEIAPYYTAQAVDQALISSQFLDEGEPVSKTNRELFVRLKAFEGGVNYEIASETGAWLGFLSGFENSEVFIIEEVMGGKRVLMVTFPDYGEADLYGYDVNAGIYLYGTTVPMPAIAA